MSSTSRLVRARRSWVGGSGRRFRRGRCRWTFAVPGGRAWVYAASARMSMRTPLICWGTSAEMRRVPAPQLLRVPLHPLGPGLLGRARRSWTSGQHKAGAAQDPVHRGRRHPHPLEVRTAMGELAVAQIDRPPLVEQGQDLGLLPGQQAVGRVAARDGIIEGAGGLAVPPPPRPGTFQLEQPADPSQRPPRVDRVVDQTEQDELGGAVNPSRDRAAQAQLAFPRRAANSIACSTITDDNRMTSARSWASSVRSARFCFGLPGRDDCSAAIAPSRAALRNVMIVERSTPASAAASTVVSWPVSIRCHKSYFCSAVRNRFARRGSGMVNGPSYRTWPPSQLWSISRWILSR